MIVSHINLEFNSPAAAFQKEGYAQELLDNQQTGEIILRENLWTSADNLFGE